MSVCDPHGVLSRPPKTLAVPSEIWFATVSECPLSRSAVESSAQLKPRQGILQYGGGGSPDGESSIGKDRVEDKTLRFAMQSFPSEYFIYLPIPTSV